MEAVVTEVGFSRLHMLGLISDAQLEAALSHPYAATVDSKADLAEHLIWMVRQEILSHADLEARANSMAPEFAKPTSQECAEIVERALHVLGLSAQNNDKNAYDQLLKYGLITTDEHAIAARTTSPYGFPDLACALMWMLHNGSIAEERWDAMRAQLRNERGDGGATECERIVEQAHESWELFKAQRPAPISPSGRKISLGGTFAATACCALVAGGYFLYQLTINIPACTADRTISQVNDMLRAAMPGAGDGQRASFALTQVKEIGYVSAHRLRGCTATVEVEKEAIPLAFTVGPMEGSYGKIGVTGTDRSIVEARFGNANNADDFDSRGQPIGREGLLAAMRNEVHAQRLLHSLLASEVSSPLSVLNQLHPNRDREIADIEPIGRCRELQAGNRYACMVMIEHNDLSFAAFGMRAQILQGEFTFLRNADSKSWKVSDDFGTAFAEAQTNAKPATFTGNHRGI